MKIFLTKLFLISVPVAALLITLIGEADGYTDYFYVRFTSPRQTSMILGTSRACQGILPQVLDSCLGRHDFFNYSFTRNTSAYGPTYLSSIKRKLDTRIKNGIFIITVDAWGISSDTPNPNDVAHFEEAQSCVAKIEDVNTNPNLHYLSEFYAGPYIKLFRKNKEMFLHDNGWLEISVNINADGEKKNRISKIAAYRKEILPFYKYSPTRYQYLLKTIDYLKRFGKVYLVRLPVHPEMMQVDNELVPNLDELIQYAANRYHIPYLDMSPENAAYRYLDGNHLRKESGKKVTLKIAHWLANQPK